MKGTSNSVPNELIKFFIDSKEYQTWKDASWLEWINGPFNKYNFLKRYQYFEPTASASIATLTGSITESITSGSLVNTYTQSPTISVSVNINISNVNKNTTIDYTIPWTKPTNDLCTWTLTYTLTYKVDDSESHIVASGSVATIAADTTSGTQTGSVTIPIIKSGTLILNCTFQNDSYAEYLVDLYGSTEVTLISYNYIAKTADDVYKIHDSVGAVVSTEDSITMGGHYTLAVVNV